MTSHPPAKLNPSDYAWMKAQGLIRLMAALRSAGGEARIVGGAVRSVLLGQPVEDVDLAANLPPERVSEILLSAGFKVIPVGFDHGTVMAVADGKGYEVTSLRKDVETDGRHAKVVYTQDWAQDAARRDFTINALYLDADGTLYDYFGGMDDIAVHRVRFVGEPEQRIREDVLRILRYFRFLAQIDGADYPSVDTQSLAACRQLAPLMISLSGERIWRELSRFLMTPNPVPAMRLALANDVFKAVLPDLHGIGRFSALIDVEKRFLDSHVIRRLAALWDGDPRQLATKLKLSRHEADRLTAICTHIEAMRITGDRKTFRQLLYKTGPDVVQDILYLALAEGRVDKDPLVRVLREWEKPVFPLKGKDVLCLGLNQGPDVGHLLSKVEAWWSAQDFTPDAQACLVKAKEIVSER